MVFPPQTAGLNLHLTRYKLVIPGLTACNKGCLQSFVLVVSESPHLLRIHPQFGASALGFLYVTTNNLTSLAGTSSISLVQLLLIVSISVQPQLHENNMHEEEEEEEKEEENRCMDM